MFLILFLNRTTFYMFMLSRSNAQTLLISRRFIVFATQATGKRVSYILKYYKSKPFNKIPTSSRKYIIS